MRLLLLTSSLPWPLEVHGGAQRTALLLEALRQFSEVDIAFVSWSKESVDLARQARQQAQGIVGLFYVPDHGGQSTGLLSKLPVIGRPFRTVQRHLAKYEVDAQFGAWLKDTIRDGQLRRSGDSLPLAWSGRWSRTHKGCSHVSRLGRSGPPKVKIANRNESLGRNWRHCRKISHVTKIDQDLPC